MVAAVIDDQYTAARVYFAAVFGVFLVESAALLPRYLRQRLTSGGRTKCNPLGPHWKLTVLCHQLVNYHVSIPFLVDHQVADILRFLVILGLNILFGINNNEFTTDYKLYGWLTIANGGLALLLTPRANLICVVLRIPSNLMLQYHRWLGMATVAHGTAHFAFNMMHYIRTDQLETSFANARIRIGTMAWLCLAIMMLTALPVVRRRGFEVFYYTHFLFFIFMVGALIHTTNGPEFLLPGFSLWVVDRVIRLYQSFRSVELQQVAHHPGGVTKFTVKGIRVSHPGQMVWVQLSDVSFLNWHPFTVVSPPGADQDVAMFAVRGLGTYTNAVQYVDKDECERRTGSPGPGIKVRLNGPFGLGRLDWHSFPVVVLVAGGIGITPGIGILSSIMRARLSLQERRNTAPADVTEIHLTWVVRSIEHSVWFEDELRKLHDLTAQPDSTVRISITLYHTESGDTQAPSQQEGMAGDSEPKSLEPWWTVKMGRPSFTQLFQTLRDEHAGRDVAVNLCGPRAMVRQARNAAVAASSSTGLFHIEDEIFER